MSRTTKILKVLGAAQRKEFHSMMLDEGLTIDDATAWLMELGHKVARASIWAYRTKVRRHAAETKVFLIQDKTDAQLKKMVRKAAASLNGSDLQHLASYTAFLLTARQPFAGAAIKAR
jgi:hypothetical protein